jgi:hypothetical protein
VGENIKHPSSNFEPRGSKEGLLVWLKSWKLRNIILSSRE